MLTYDSKGVGLTVGTASWQKQDIVPALTKQR